MKPIGIPRFTESENCDVQNAREYGKKASAVNLPGRSGDIWSNFKNPASKAAARRY